ncbi:unnamed protein product [Rotaria sp. Silwood2]|nr:unnamed protein product [Rotaria sp. Silwood2]CAF3069435.1 unnamed protein product [Rotaria sp. Silwood2]CAF3233377.1 unnamed protein product [Rotaria sp. Silwood2]CAF3307549.1 unnamed protein product [Rotaria sp. Silwood2]CAF4170907.1 unnamed protein product [Rotaria sp. Silwood2]
MKHQNQVSSKFQAIVSVALVSSSSLLSHSSSATNPSFSKHHLSNNNTPVLPSYAVLPPSHARPSSSTDDNRSITLAEPITSHSGSHHRHAHRNSSLSTLDQEKHSKFLSKISQNDTLQRRNRDLQLNNHLRLYQQT